MSYRIELLPSVSAVCVTFTDRVTLQERASALEDILLHRDDSQADNLLVDMSDATVVEGSHVETIDYAARLARQTTLRTMQVAYIGDRAHGANIEALAALRGYLYRRFPTRGAALRWMSNGWRHKSRHVIHP